MTILRFGRVDKGLRLPALHDVLWWALAIAIVLAAVRLFWIAITPLSPVGDWRPAGVRLMDDATRSALMTGFDPFNRTASGAVVAAEGTETITSLPLTLYGVMVNVGTAAGRAIIAGSDGEQALYRVGEEVLDGAILGEVRFDHVVLNRGGARELLYMDQSQPAPTIAPAAPAAPNAGAAAGGNPLSAAALRRGIAINPRAGEGGVVGLEVAPTGDGTSFRAAGLQAGDVVVAVGGKRIADAADLSRLSGQIQDGASIALTVSRGGKEVPVTLKVAP